jgi:hypothetical protein
LTSEWGKSTDLIKLYEEHHLFHCLVKESVGGKFKENGK